jgi:hypothetical protein
MFMPDIQINDPYTNKPTFYKYDSNDRQLLVDLLNEYSSKLIESAHELESTRKIESKRSNIKNLLVLSILSVTFVLLIQIFPLILSIKVESQFLWSHIILLTVSLACFVSIVGLVKNAIKTSEQTIKYIDLLKEDAESIADKLEKVMRVTIEIQDQLEINLARKLELDLRIADAQSALKYYYSVVDTKSDHRKSSPLKV